MASLFTWEGKMADRNASFCSLLLGAIFLSCFLLDSLTSLAYAAQIYYPYSNGICPYMGRMDCGMHLRLFITVVLAATGDTAISMAFTFINETWLEGQHNLRLTLHITNFLLETLLLVCAGLPPRFGMTKGQGGGVAFIVVSAFFTVLTLICTLIGFQKLLLAVKATMAQIRPSYHGAVPADECSNEGNRGASLGNRSPFHPRSLSWHKVGENLNASMPLMQLSACVGEPEPQGI
jgi:hypothetical protein